MHRTTNSKSTIAYIGDEEKMGLLDDANQASSSSSDMESDGGRPLLEPDSSGRINLLQPPPTPQLFSTVKSHLPHLQNYMSSVSWGLFLTRFLYFLVPSFLQGRAAREQFLRPTHKVAPTAYLDGIRGLAALFVYFCHYSYQCFTIAKSWGTDEHNLHFLKLPFIRIWYQGPAAVCVFFVISGYALSYKPLKLMRSHSFGDFAGTMSSLTFRRALRLYVPTAMSTLMIALCLQLGVYEWTRDFANDGMYMRNVVEPHPHRLGSLSEQLVHWGWEMFRFFSVFNWDIMSGQPSYDVHLWTIPVEFRCSLYLFLVLLATARLQTKFRYLTVGTIFCFVYRNSRWDLMLFLCGMMIAEFDLIRGAHNTTPTLPLDEKSAPLTSRRGVKSLIWGSLSILGMYLLCQPDQAGEFAPGWVWLTSLIPEWWAAEEFRYWQSIGAVIFVVAVGHSTSWQRFFNSGPIQYLGKLSYAIYLMHAPAMHMMGYHWEKWAYSVTGVEGSQFNWGFFLGACFCVPTVVWWADVFWRAVDIPAVKFARWLEAKLIVKAHQ